MKGDRALMPNPGGGAAPTGDGDELDRPLRVQNQWADLESGLH